jgi:DNA invertase Pin-like site-specific DNA recombinase
MSVPTDVAHKQSLGLARMLTPRQESMRLSTKQVSLPWAIYARVSTVEQGEKYSPASQRKTLLRLAEEIGVNVPEKFILVDMKSGRNEDRADYQRLLKLAKDKQIGGALVLELSRVGRSVTDSLAFRSMLKKEGVAVAFALQQFDDSPQGKFMWTQFAAVAELEADLILQRTSKGRLQKAQEGLINDPHTFGYQYTAGVRLPGGKYRSGFIEEHETEGGILRMMFEDYAKNGSAMRVQMALNDAGILTKRGNSWSNPSVLKMLRNPIYTGVYTTNVKGEDLQPVKVTIKVPALISKALFDKVQVMLAHNGERAGRPSTTNLLGGLIHCTCTLPSGEACERRWTMNWKPYYSCSNFYDNHTREKLCGLCSKPIRIALFDSLVLDQVRTHMGNPETAYSAAKAYHAEMSRTAEKAISVETKLARLEERYKNTEQKLLANIPQRTLDKLAQQLREMAAQRLELEVEAREAAVVVLPALDRVEHTCQQLQKGLDGLKTFDEKRTFLLKTVERIDTDGRDYAIYCRIELAAMAAGRNSKLGHNPVDYFSFVIRGQVAA